MKKIFIILLFIFNYILPAEISRLDLSEAEELLEQTPRLSSSFMDAPETPYPTRRSGVYENDMRKFIQQFSGLKTPKQLQEYLAKLSDSHRTKLTGGYDANKLWRIINWFSNAEVSDIETDKILRKAELLQKVADLQKRFEEISDFAQSVYEFYNIYDKSIKDLTSINDVINNGFDPGFENRVRHQLFFMEEDLEAIESASEISKERMIEIKQELNTYQRQLLKLKPVMENIIKHIARIKSQQTKDKILEEETRLNAYLKKLDKIAQTKYSLRENEKEYNNLKIVLPKFIEHLNSLIANCQSSQACVIL